MSEMECHPYEDVSAWAKRVVDNSNIEAIKQLKYKRPIMRMVIDIALGRMVKTWPTRDAAAPEEDG